MRILIRLSALYLSALLAHALAGGSILESPQLITLLISLTALVLALSRVELEGPTLALVILGVQSGSHFIVGGGTFSNSSLMTVAHSISGLASYFLIKHLDAALEFITHKLYASLVYKPFPIFAPLELSPRPDIFHTNFQPVTRLAKSLTFRGPPSGGKSE